MIRQRTPRSARWPLLVALFVLAALLSGPVPSQPASALPPCNRPDPPPICEGKPDPSPPPKPPPPPSGSPTGILNHPRQVPGGLRVTGTAQDPDAAGPVTVQVRRGGSLVGSLSTVNGAFDGTFSVTPGNEQVCATAVNRNAGADKLLGCWFVTIGVIPFGSVEYLESFGSQIRAIGWAVDPDTSAPIDVHLYVDSAGQAFNASGNRPDVGAANPEYGPNHGFDITTAVSDGWPKVCVYAINVGAGDSNPQMACKRMRILTHTAPNFGPAAQNALMSFEPYDQPGTYIRLSNGQPYVGGIDRMGDMDVSDSWFIKRSGLSNGTCSSFESVRFAGRFLRHQKNTVRVDSGFGNPWFGEDATFCPAGNRYEAANKPGWFLRHSGSELKLSQLWSLTNDDVAADDNTVFFEQGPNSLGLSAFGGSSRQEGEYDIQETYGACTGLTPLGGVPRTTVAQTVLFDHPRPYNTVARTIRKVATGAPYAGWYPWIRITSRHGGHAFKIETGRNLCAF